MLNLFPFAAEAVLGMHSFSAEQIAQAFLIGSVRAASVLHGLSVVMLMSPTRRCLLINRVSDQDMSPNLVEHPASDTDQMERHRLVERNTPSDAAPKAT